MPDAPGCWRRRWPASPGWARRSAPGRAGSRPASSGSPLPVGAAGSLTVDEGARAALTERGRSLLAAGVTGRHGGFRPEEAVEIAGPDGEVFAKGLVRVHADRAAEWMGRRSQVVVHRDDLVLVT